MRYVNESRRGPRKVRVEGRDEIGEVIDEGVNIGDTYCVVVHFRSTGECTHFVKDRDISVDEARLKSPATSD
jgi:hypothetical protein